MEIKEQIWARMYIGMTLVGLIPLLICIQLIRIYWIDGDDLRQRGEQQATLYETVPAMRGSIIDRNGRVLARNEARYHLIVDPQHAGFDEIRGKLVAELSKVTKRPTSELNARIQQRRTSRHLVLARRLTEIQKQTIENLGIEGIRFEQEITRRYTYDHIAGQVLGYVAANGDSVHGMLGLELEYDSHLRGTAGRRPMQKNRRGDVRPVPGSWNIPPRHGGDIVLTLDLTRQTIMEQELLQGIRDSGANWGTAIAMDPKTGEILAMANGPSFNPNRPGSSPDRAQNNFAIMAQIEPGSTFKIVTAVASMDLGQIQLVDTVDTGAGARRFGDRILRDDHAIGRVAFVDVIAQSSNVGTATVASRISSGKFYQYARNLGFGQPTWIDLPGEVVGTLKKPEAWSGSTQAWMSHGYEVSASAIQLLTAYASLANGGVLVQPHIVSQKLDASGHVLWEAKTREVRRAYRPEIAKGLMPAFERVVERGTARSAYVEGLRIAGKTGTAKKYVTDHQEYVDGAYRASFVGLYPADDPVVAMVVILDEPTSGFYGGDVAAPIFRRIAERWIGTFPAVASRLAPPEAFPIVEQVAVPDVLGIPASVAVSRLTGAGLELDSPDRNVVTSNVKRQFPLAGEIVPRGTRVHLEMNESPATRLVRMPDLRGMTVRQAVNLLAASGVEPQVKGAGVVWSQSPAAGEAIPARAVLECR